MHRSNLCPAMALPHCISQAWSDNVIRQGRGVCEQVAFEHHPLQDGFTLWNTLRVLYVAIFAVYWLYNLAHLFVDLREAAVISHFTRHRLGLSTRQLKTVTWPEVARRIVDVSESLHHHVSASPAGGSCS